MTTFPIRYTGLNTALRYLGLGPEHSGVDVDGDTVGIRLGWAFHLEAARSSIATVAIDESPVRGWGAHGWRNVWLVNGSSSGIVRIDFTAKVPARTLVVPLSVRAVRVSVEDPEALIAVLA